MIAGMKVSRLKDKNVRHKRDKIITDEDTAVLLSVSFLICIAVVVYGLEFWIS
jgi:hypothetical protein